MISVIIPSRSRPNELLTTINSLELVKHGLEALIWLDHDDPKLAEYKKLLGSKPKVSLFIKKRVGYKKFHLMLNFLCKHAKYDWIFEFNDDAYMDNPKWFDIFKDFVSKFDPTTQPVVLNIWGQGETDANLFPIVSRSYLNILKHFALFPACDLWARSVAAEANISYDLKGIKPKHRKNNPDDILVDDTFWEVEKIWAKNLDKWNPNGKAYRKSFRQDIKRIVDYNKSQDQKSPPKIKTVGFIGLGKLGLPIAETVAKKGFKVLGYDIKPTKTKVPRTHSIAELVQKSDLVFCAVQTPHDPLYEGDKPLPASRADFNYSYLIKAVKEVTAQNKKITLVVISTCLPGTYEQKIKPLLTPNINYLYNPFFIAMGTVVEDFLNPEFVLIGGDSPSILKDFYIKIHGKDKTFITDITTAEGIKVFYNTFVTTKTVLGNMYGEFAYKTGMNVDHIYQALSKATDRLISPKYLKSGMADGGGCHPRDNIALSYLAKKLDLSFDYFGALMTAREKHTRWLADIFTEQIKSNKLQGIILGKSFKPETDIQTGSAAILLANILKQKKVPFKHYEFDYPKVLPVAVYFTATEHQKYNSLRFPAGSVVIDPFRYIKPQQKVKIIAIGSPEKANEG